MKKWEAKVFDYIKNENTYNKIKKYVDLILQENKKYNLTGFDEEKIWLDGIYQSIFLLNNFINYNNNQHLLDIGAGAGFPSLPFYLFQEEKMKLTICEPLLKRAKFLNLVKKELNLQNLTIINKRLEDTDWEEKFDFICARAVMDLRKLIEISSKCGKINCQYIFLKSKNVHQEINDAKTIIDKLNIKDLKVETIDLKDDKEHNVVIYTKQNKTPQNFPRKWHEIVKNKL